MVRKENPLKSPVRQSANHQSGAIGGVTAKRAARAIDHQKDGKRDALAAVRAGPFGQPAEGGVLHHVDQAQAGEDEAHRRRG